MTEWHAEDYHRESGLQQAMAQEQLGRLTLAGDERILDVGCGDGRITAEIAARVPRGSVLGVDPSRDMVQFASSRFGPPAHVNLRFEVGDAARLPYREEFDLVVSFNALHWVIDQAAALAGIRASLRPGGRALLRFVPNGPRKCLEEVIEEVRRRPRWAEHFVGFETPYVHYLPEEYRALAEQAGLAVTRLQVDDKAWDFGSRDGFMGFSRATLVNWTDRLPEQDCDAFIAEVLDAYQAVAADNPSEANTFKFYQMEVELAAANL
jgi:trans-aconitate 2-methyltransferase